ncbi:MAG TPA: polysaccharide deacetylase family protein [Prolixibacteraceae bacterium]|nr:polysaccharide deacetylase family protein [Prolixibacteraceae bacterium]
MILVYTEEINPRINYSFNLIFRQILGDEVHFTSKRAEFIESDLPKINYSYEKFGNEYYIKPHRFLHCKALIQPTIQPVWYNGNKYFFESSNDSDLPFDPFAASFYLVSRYEEYLDVKRGKYKRFSAGGSILAKYNLLKKPVVNIWANLLAGQLKEKYPNLTFKKKKFEFCSTVDIDNAWAFKNKGIIRTGGALLKSLVKGNLQEYNQRVNVFSGKTTDPYDTYSYLNSVFKEDENNVIFFFLLGDYKRYDKNVHYKNKQLQKLIREIGEKYQIGIHPSYSSSKKNGKKKVVREKERLEQITGGEILKTRQHFLRLKFPRTYRRLLKAGLAEDYTMGYASHTGFRAGICTPFYWYDLKKETATNLLVYPFQVMDVTLRDYMKLAPEDALREALGLMEEVKNVGGVFISIWHNETVNDLGHWKGYRQVFENINNKGFEWANEQ